MKNFQNLYLLGLWHCLLLFGSFSSFCQKNNDETLFNQGKMYLSDSNFVDAGEIFQGLFKSLPDKNELGACSGYLGAFALHKLKKNRDANFLLFQLIQKYPKWSGIELAYHLKGTVQATDRYWADALFWWTKISSDSKWDNHIRYQITKLPSDTLDLMISKFPEMRFLLQEKKQRTPPLKTFESIQIGLLLPLDQMYTNSSVVDIVKATQYVADSLKMKNKRIELKIFDTGKDSLSFSQLLSKKSLMEIDIFIGPLYGVHQKMMSDFCIKNQKLVLNPISQYGSYSATNPYFYLFNPTYQSQGEAIANAAFNINSKQLAILYGDKTQDSLIAYACKASYESFGGQIPVFRKLDKTIASYASQILSKIPIDTLGKIVLCTSEPTLVSNVFAYLETTLLEKTAVYKETTIKTTEEKEKEKELKSKDEEKKIYVKDIPVFGYKDWLEINSISFEQFVIHETHFLNTDFLQENSLSELEKKYLEQVGVKPGVLFFKTLDIMTWAIDNIEKLYENSAKRTGLLRSDLKYMPSVDFSKKNDNTSVPIVKLENYILRKVNK